MVFIASEKRYVNEREKRAVSPFPADYFGRRGKNSRKQMLLICYVMLTRLMVIIISMVAPSVAKSVSLAEARQKKKEHLWLQLLSANRMAVVELLHLILSNEATTLQRVRARARKFSRGGRRIERTTPPIFSSIISGCHVDKRWYP